MTSEVELKGHGHDDNSRKLVEVSLNGEDLKIHSGKYSLPELKIALGVDAHCDLDLIEHGVFRPIKPDEIVKVKEGMEFISRQCAGGAS
jgi:hypothetical protein